MIKMIIIYNMHSIKPSKPYDIKVDRSSILGSPYYLKSEKDRNNICNLYHEWFYKNVDAPGNERMTFKKELTRLIDIYLEHNKLNLFCWCAPKRCHAKTIRQYILNKVTNKGIIGDD